MATGRNEPCPCGSGKKYKHCCEGKQRSGTSSRLLIAAIAAVVLVAIMAMMSNSREGGSAPSRVWSPEHGHYHDATGREIPR
jgi:hypothetical protein